MTSQGFRDLDELVVACRNDQARMFIQEAVQCYRAGAYRQTIVATWIAVFYDVIFKLQELELSGDGNAAKRIVEYEEIRQKSDIEGALTFERKILNIAKDEFELISDVEHSDLTRLREDRNRCAYPVLNAFDEVYQPSAELARTHLRNAIEHMLQRPPVQGKAALEKLQRDIASDYFPTSKEEAKTYLSKGPLQRARTSLVRSFVIVVIKSLLVETIHPVQLQRLKAAFEATRDLYPGIVENVFREKLNDIVINLPDEDLIAALRFVATTSDSWNYLLENSIIRIKNLVENLTEENSAVVINLALKIPDLEEAAIKRIGSINDTNLLTLVSWGNTHPAIIERAVNLYINSSSYWMANHIGNSLIIPLASYISPDAIERIIEACKQNDQIRKSFDRNDVLIALRKSECIPVEQFDDLLRKNGIEIESEAINDTPNN